MPSQTIPRLVLAAPMSGSGKTTLTAGLIAAFAARASRRPGVYFEKWHKPLISGIGWVGELIEIAGGRDIFSDVKGANAPQRVVLADEVLRRNPDMILASWCGMKVNTQSIMQRPGWDQMEAVKHQRVHEIKSACILEPGPAILKGLEQIHTLIMKEFNT